MLLLRLYRLHLLFAYKNAVEITHDCVGVGVCVRVCMGSECCARVSCVRV